MAHSAGAPSPRRVALARGHALEYVERGRGSGTPLVLLPGLGDSYRSFEPVLQRPSSERSFAVSQRGHGDSDRPLAGYLPGDYAADVVEFLNAVGVARCVLVGHSSGALTARRVAIDNPDRVRALVLIGAPATLANNPAARSMAETVLSHLEDPITMDFVRDFAAGTFVRPPPPSFLEMAYAENLKVPARVWRETFDGLIAYDDSRDLGRIIAPTLLVWGTADDIVPRADQDTLAAAIPDCRLIEYDGVGHSPHWEDPARFAADLAAFARSL